MGIKPLASGVVTTLLPGAMLVFTRLHVKPRSTAFSPEAGADHHARVTGVGAEVMAAMTTLP